MIEDFDMKCESCMYCETLYGSAYSVCRYNGKACPTDGSCYKDETESEVDE